jgi:HAD superfamily hydrolase (TIGR01509 family)
LLPTSRAIIFDFDGVLADSEVLSNAVLASIVTELGVPTTIEDSYRIYMGKRHQDVIETIARVVGRALPSDFPDSYQRRIFEAFKAELKEVAGARNFIEAWREVPQCIASSSSPERLALSLEVLGLAPHFEGRVFSASMVARGKPHPDIFLFAANQLGVVAADCIVIEDSASGVIAGRAAGCTVIGFTAGGHVPSDHDSRLREAGAHHVAASFADLDRIIRPLLSKTRK